MAIINRHCFALDLKPDEELIAAYEEHHKKVWPSILESIQQSGIEKLEIYRIENRLFMIMDVNESFSFGKKKKIDEASMDVQEWEKLMWKYQQALPGAKPGEKWIRMQKIFTL